MKKEYCSPCCTLLGIATVAMIASSGSSSDPSSDPTIPLDEGPALRSTSSKASHTYEVLAKSAPFDFMD